MMRRDDAWPITESGEVKGMGGEVSQPGSQLLEPGRPKVSLEGYDDATAEAAQVASGVNQDGEQHYLFDPAHDRPWCLPTGANSAPGPLWSMTGIAMLDEGDGGVRCHRDRVDFGMYVADHRHRRGGRYLRGRHRILRRWSRPPQRTTPRDCGIALETVDAGLTTIKGAPLPHPRWGRHRNYVSGGRCALRRWPRARQDGSRLFRRGHRAR